jgi:glycosyltransferase involved in cell wall biosynthesis
MGVDAERFRPTSAVSAWRTSFEELGDFVIGWTGSVRRFHNLDLALRAIRQLRSAGHSFGLVVAGEGQDLSRLKAIASDLELGHAVSFVGQIPNTELPGLLAALDAAIITTDAEQQFHYSPLKLREYMAIGLPVVVPAVGDPGRLITQNESGLLYETGSVDSLSAALLKLSSDSDLSVRLGANAREQILQSGTWDAISAGCIEVLKDHRLR